MVDVSALRSKVEAFRRLHTASAPLVMPNPWDVGSAKILAGLGFHALATTSSGMALTLGRRDYRVTRDEALAHCQAIASAVEVPVSADLENGFGLDPEVVQETIRMAAATGLAGGSIEDSSGDAQAPILDVSLAVERIAAAAEAARAAPGGFVLTARAEALLWGSTDVDAVITRLVAYADAGADVLYAPGLADLGAVRKVCSAVARPVNVLLYRGLRSCSRAALGEAGAARLSTGGRLAMDAYSSLIPFAASAQQGPFDRTAPTSASDIPQLMALLE